jgi:hypothetical protein
MYGLLRPMFRALGRAWGDATVAGKVLIVLVYVGLALAIGAFYASLANGH